MFLPIGNSLLNFNCIFFSSSSAGCAHRILHEALSKKLSNTSSSSLIVSLSFRGTPKKWPAVDTINNLRLSSTTIFVNSGNILLKTAKFRKTNVLVTLPLRSFHETSTKWLSLSRGDRSSCHDNSCPTQTCCQPVPRAGRIVPLCKQWLKK